MNIKTLFARKKKQARLTIGEGIVWPSPEAFERMTSHSRLPHSKWYLLIWHVAHQPNIRPQTLAKRTNVSWATARRALDLIAVAMRESA